MEKSKGAMDANGDNDETISADACREKEFEADR